VEEVPGQTVKKDSTIKVEHKTGPPPVTKEISSTIAGVKERSSTTKSAIIESSAGVARVDTIPLTIVSVDSPLITVAVVPGRSGGVDTLSSVAKDGKVQVNTENNYNKPSSVKEPEPMSNKNLVHVGPVLPSKPGNDSVVVLRNSAAIPTSESGVDMNPAGSGVNAVDVKCVVDKEVKRVSIPGVCKLLDK